MEKFLVFGWKSSKVISAYIKSISYEILIKICRYKLQARTAFVFDI